MAPRRSDQCPPKKELSLSVPIEISRPIIRRGRAVSRCLFGRPDPGENLKWLNKFFAESHHSVEDKWEIIKPLRRKFNSAESGEQDYYLGKPKVPPTPRKCAPRKSVTVVEMSERLFTSPIFPPELEKILYEEQSMSKIERTPLKQVTLTNPVVEKED